ncbi:MAG: hypothetical protein HDR93_02000 [Bacteroides sp.]|nr:hypothetical protein [Bacteroides sp.]MBD5342015.1 hypothetical protein [Bacteroides sp.]
MKITDRLYLNLFSGALLIPLFVKGLTLLRGEINGVVTAMIYMGFLLFALFRIFRRILVKDVFILLGIYAFFMANILLFPSTLSYYSGKTMVMVLVFYLPLCTFVVTRIRDWNKLFDVIRPYALFSVALALYIVFFSKRDQYSTFFFYMEFSYALFPFAASLYVVGRRNRSLIWLGLFVVDAICMLSYGARATFMLLILFIAMYEFFNSKARYRIMVIIALVLVGLIVSAYFDSIILSLSHVDGLQDSRLITKALRGELTDGGDRDRLIRESLHRIETMGADIPGLFGDRPYIHGIYPHNIALEILMQFGVLLGSMIILGFLWMMYVNVMKTPYRNPSIFLCCVLLGRFLVSGSYIQEGDFWLWLFAMVNIFKQRQKSVERNGEYKKSLYNHSNV